MHRVMIVAFWLTGSIAISSAADFRYEVRRDQRWGGETGVLTIDDRGVHYQSENGKTILDFPFREIWKADVSDPRKVRIYSYERSKRRLALRRRFDFVLSESASSEGLAAFLAERLERPVIGAYPAGAGGVKIPAFHKHILNGCHGILTLGEDAIRFESHDAKHSRTWTFEDIETIGTPDAFHFRLTSYAETYKFDLKGRLPDAEYRSAWMRIYDLNGE